jgi:hypothetical protein
VDIEERAGELIEDEDRSIVVDKGSLFMIRQTVM